MTTVEIIYNIIHFLYLIFATIIVVFAYYKSTIIK